MFGLIPEGGNIVKGGLNIAKKPLKGLIGEIGDQFTKHVSKSAKKFIDPARKKAADVYCGWFGYEPISSPYATIYLNKGSSAGCKETVERALGGGAKKAATQIEEVEYGKRFTRVNRKKALKPNVKYTTPGGYTYKTDGKGRISHVQGDLKLETEKKNLYAQRKAGEEDRLPDDEGGHLIASIFGGEGGLDNLVPQNGNLNKGEWKKMENMWADALRSGKKVKVKIKPVYNGDSKRPDRFEVQYKIDDEVWERGGGVKRMDEAKLERIYHQIAQTIVEIIPEEWEKVYLYGEVLEGVQSTFFYYYPHESDQPIYSLDIPELFDVDEEEYDQLKGQLYDLLRDLWNESKREGNEVWTNLTLILDISGKFKIEYGYEGLSETNSFVRNLIWRYNTLGLLPKGDYAMKILKEHLQDNKSE